MHKNLNKLQIICMLNPQFVIDIGITNTPPQQGIQTKNENILFLSSWANTGHRISKGNT